MTEATRGRNKAETLRQHGTLNPRPSTVRNELFDAEFFDPQDLMQVKYEMLRAVQHDNRPITEITAEFGLSRPAFYRAQENFEAKGLAGLLPLKRGPKSPHKLTADMLEFIGQLTSANKRVSAQELRDRIETRFGTRIHTRTVQRARERMQKGGSRP